MVAEGDFDKVAKTKLTFFDTKDHSLRRSRLNLRLRRSKGETPWGEITLKRRTEDRYMAEGVDLQAAKGFESKRKLEEDIGAPFVSRFSHSRTIEASEPIDLTTLADAAELFLVLGKISCNGRPCDPATPLRSVNGLVAHERVLKGPKFSISSGASTSVALILWSHRWNGRIIAAEFSSRYGNEDEDYSSAGVGIAFDLFAEIQKLDWCVGGKIKTQLADGEV